MIVNSVKDLAGITFGGIRTTADCYRAAFDDVIKTCGLIVWIRLEIRTFAQAVTKLAFGGHAIFQEVSECLQVSRGQCASVHPSRSTPLTLLFS